MKKTIKTILILITCLPLMLGLFYIFVVSIYGAQDDNPEFESQSAMALSKVDKILTANHICSTSSLYCADSPLKIHVKGVRHGIHVEIYDTTSQRLSNQLLELFMREFFENPSMKELSIQVYDFSTRGDQVPALTRLERGPVSKIELWRK